MQRKEHGPGSAPISVCRGASLEQTACLPQTHKSSTLSLKLGWGGVHRLKPNYFCLGAGRVPMWTLGVPEEDRTYSCSQFVNLDFSLTQFETYSLNHKHHGEEVGRNNNRQRCLQKEGQTQNCRRAPPSGLLITSASKQTGCGFTCRAALKATDLITALVVIFIHLVIFALITAVLC